MANKIPDLIHTLVASFRFLPQGMFIHFGRKRNLLRNLYSNLKFYKKSKSFNKGISLIEIMVVIGLFAIIASFSAFMGIDDFRRTVSKNDIEVIMRMLSKARSQAISNVCLGSSCSEGQPHGFHIEQGSYTIFQGNTYNPSDSLNETVGAEGGIVSISGISDVVFSQLSGDVSSSGSIILNDQNGRTYRIDINSERRNYISGFSTVEIVIAMAILIIVVSGVVFLVSSNQNILVDSQTNSEAITIAQRELESMQALARKDFRLVNDKEETEDIYEKIIKVERESSPFIKKVTSIVKWKGPNNREQKVELSSLVTNFENAVGGDTCDSMISGDWKDPDVDTIDLGVSHPISDIDAHKNRLYVTVDSSPDSTLFIYNIENHDSPVFLGSLDTSSVSSGPNAITVATSSNGNFAYIANSYGANFSTCQAKPYNPPTPSNCAQLQVVDVTDPVNPTVALNFLVPTTSPSSVTGSGGGAVGRSIFYKDGYVYLGLSKTSTGPEFNIIDVHERPINPRWVGGYQVGSAVNAIFVKGNYAYLATPDSEELIILNISNPGNPVRVSGFNAVDGSGNGKSIAVVGDDLFLGRTTGNNEFYSLDIKNSENPIEKFQKDAGSSVNDLLVRDYLAFLVTTSGKLQIWNVKNPTNVTPWTEHENTSEFVNLSGGSINTLDCENNTLYAGSQNGIISFITAN
jgi:Tfp pilus assembly protein FimT